MNKPKAIVIGSGFGGLSSAIRLQAMGFQTTIFEKRDLPGGRAYVFKDDGFTFDAGPTVITAPETIRELFELAGKKMEDYVELIPITPFYRLMWEDGYKFDYSNDEKSLFSQIEAKNPEDLVGYKKFLAYSKEVFHEGFTKLGHVPFLNWWSMIRVSPQLMRLGAYRSVYSKVAEYIKDKHLRQAFSFHSLLVGGNPFKTSSIYTLIHYLERNWGVTFPRGGTGALVQGMIKLFQDIGGELKCNAEIDEILTRDGKVTGVLTKAGVKQNCDIVVTNAEVMHTYRDLLKNETRVAGTRKRLGKMSYSMSLFLIYFGTNKKYEGLAHHNILFGPRYKELLTDIFDNGIISDDFSLYLHNPTLTDPSLAPPGKQGYYVLAPVPHLGKTNVDWKTFAPIYADRIMTYLDKHYMPGLKGDVVTQRLFTPEDFQTVLNSHLGSAFSLEPTLTQSAYFRTHNRDKDISGLYFAGAGTHPGAGLPGVISSAKATAGVIWSDLQAKNLDLVVEPLGSFDYANA